MIEIKVAIDTNEYWNWCVEHLTNSWRKKIPILGTTSTYIFDYPEDATAFKLKFGL